MSTENSGSFVKNFLILFTGNSIGQVVPFLLAPFIARLYQPEQIAIQENFLAMASLIGIIAAGRFDLAILLPKEEKDARTIFSLSFIITICISALCILAVFFAKPIAQFYQTPILADYIFYLAPSVFLISALSILTQWVLRQKQYHVMTVSRVLQSFIQNGGYVILGYLGWGIHGLLISWILGIIIPVLWMFVKELNTFRPFVTDKTEIKRLATEHKDFPTVNSLHAFTDILATQFLLYWLITRNHGALVLGLFAVMNRYLRAPLNLVGSAVGQLYFREASSLQGNNQEQVQIYYRSIKIISLFVVPAMIVIVIMGPTLFEWYLGKDWRDSGTFARIMAPAILFNFLASVVSTTPLLLKKQKAAYVFSIMGYILSLGTLLIGSYLSTSFEEVLYAYSVVLSLYYIFLLVWYRSILLNSKL